MCVFSYRVSRWTVHYHTLQQLMKVPSVLELRQLLGKLGKTPEVEECRPTIKLEDFTYMAVIPALLVILVASVLQKRKGQRYANLCHNRPGTPVPVDLLSGNEDRFVYAAAFGSTATNCLTLLRLHFVPTDSHSAQMLFAMLTVTIMGIDYYPFFTCIGQKNSLAWAMVGTLYSCAWFVVNLLSAIQCEDRSSWLIPAQPIIVQLPVLVCLAYLVCFFVIRAIHLAGKMFTDHISRPCCNHQDDKTKFTRSHHVHHVTNLLRKRTTHVTSSWPSRHRWRSMFSYKRDSTFRFSPGIIATVVVALLCLYEFALMEYISVERWMQKLRSFLTSDNSKTSGVRFVYSADILGQVTLFLDVLHISWYIAFAISLVAMVTYVMNICVSYRHQYKCLLKGDYSFMPPHCTDMSNTSVLSNSLMYSGLQIAFIFWAFSLMTLTFIVCNLILAYFLVLPMMGLVSDSFLVPVRDLVPAVGISMGVYLVQVVISKTLLLQPGSHERGLNDRLGHYLALNNRRLYHNISYFMFFYYIFLGLFRSFLRVLLGLLHGVVFLGRLDRSGLVQGMEVWDKGYMAYICLLRLEVTHCHPVLVTFCHLMNSEVSGQGQVEGCNYCITKTRKMSFSRARKRWLLLYTLVNNTSVVQYRKHNCNFYREHEYFVAFCGD